MSTPQRITPECQPVFPCWLWMQPEYAQFEPAGWSRHIKMHGTPIQLVDAGWTHWHPDQPTAPEPVKEPALPSKPEATATKWAEAVMVLFRDWQGGEDSRRLALIVRGYESGYQAGHNDTVEACFRDAHESALEAAPEILKDFDAAMQQEGKQ